MNTNTWLHNVVAPLLWIWSHAKRKKKKLEEEIKLHWNYLVACPHYQRHSIKFFPIMLRELECSKFQDENQSPTALVVELLHL